METNYEIEPMYSFKFKSVSDCRNAERECKRILGNGVILKENIKDGYTETTTTDNCNTIIDIYTKLGGIKG